MKSYIYVEKERNYRNYKNKNKEAITKLLKQVKYLDP